MKVKVQKNKIICTIFIVYLVVLFKVVLFKYETFENIITGNTGINFRSLNLVPFKTIIDFFSIGIKNNNLLWAFSNIFGNILIFMPLGYILPMIFEKFRNLKNIAITVFILSLFFELTQYIGHLGSLDIDDLILNIIGGVSGYLVYIVIKKLLNNDKKLNEVTFILSVISCVIAFTIAKGQFGDLLGLTSHDVITIGQENMPNREPDLIGTYLDISNNKIHMYKGIVSDNSSDKEFLEKLNIEINDEIRFYCTEMKESKNNSTITYKEISRNEFLQYEPYSILKIWYDENNKEIIDTIEVSIKINSSISNTTIETNEKKEINGYVEEINNNGIVINLITVQELENGSLVSVVGKEENANLINIKTDKDTKYILNLSKDDGDLVEEKECTKDDIEIKDTVLLKGVKKGDTLIADVIEIYKIVD